MGNGKKAKIGRVLQYGALNIEVRGAEKAGEFNSVKSPEGSLFVIVGIKLENARGAGTEYIVPDEEIWLNCGAGEPVKSENYRFETALDKGKPSEGHVWFIVPAGANKFSILFGKRKMPKIPVDFSL